MAPTDRWGSRLGTQAARINELLSGGAFLSVNEVLKILVREFPTTTAGRVRQHCYWLRKNHPSRLQERRAGRRVSYRLV